MLIANKVILLTAEAKINELKAERWSGVAEGFRKIAERLDKVAPDKGE